MWSGKTAAEFTAKLSLPSFISWRFQSGRSGGKRFRAGVGGFTLLEVLFASAIAVSVIGIAGYLMIAHARLSRDLAIQQEIETSARKTLQALENSVKSATEIRVEENGQVLIVEFDDGASVERWRFADGTLFWSQGAGPASAAEASPELRHLSSGSFFWLEPAPEPGLPPLAGVSLVLSSDASSSEFAALVIETQVAARTMAARAREDLP